MHALLSMIVALAVTAALTPVIIRLAHQRGWVVAPREDRWHRRPTAIFGGIGIAAGFFSGVLVSSSIGGLNHWALLGGAGAMFLLGLADDIWELSPQFKFLVQVVVASAVVAMGVSMDLLPWKWMNVPLSILWLVGITNALNILDNMDGLAAGVAGVASVVMAISGLMSGLAFQANMAAALAGAAVGFLFYNFHPAKIFMGDCGSLMLGFTLAALGLMGVKGEAGHVILAVIVPLGALVVPLLDTTLVSFVRTTSGRSIAQGGRDHTSHRLVMLGLSERKAVGVLLGISLGCGLGALGLSWLATPLVTLVVAAIVTVVLVFFGVFLGSVEVYGDKGQRRRVRWGPVLGRVVMHKKQLLQIAVDMVLFSASYMAAYLLRFEGRLNPPTLNLVLKSLPVVVGVKMVAMWIFGLYRGEWRYISIHDLIQLVKACLLGSLGVTAAMVLFWRFGHYSRAAMIIDFFLGLMFVAGSRLLVRIFYEAVVGNLAENKKVPVVVFGAGDGGELLLRELKGNPRLPYRVVGFIDDDPAKLNQLIHGVPVLGTRQDLSKVIAEYGVKQVFISILSAPEEGFEDVFELCQRLGVGCQRIRPMIKL